MAEYAQNSLCKPSTGITPFQCILGFQPPLFPWSGEPSDLPAVNSWLQHSEEHGTMLTSSTKSSSSHQRTGQSSSASQPQIPARVMGLVVHPGSKALVTLQKAQSQVRGSLQNHQTNHSSLIQISITCSLPYLTHLSSRFKVQGFFICHIIVIQGIIRSEM